MKFNQMVRGELSNYDTVVLGASWHAYVRDPSFESDFRQALRQLTEAGKTVVIALIAPGFMEYNRECSKKSIKIPFMSCEKQTSYADKGDYAANKLVGKIALEYPRTSIFGLRDLICRNGTCSAYLNGSPFYYYEGQLSIIGSEMLGAEALRTKVLPLGLLAILSRSGEPIAKISNE
ncbi:SGNH hydrolase domain-containing protein [Pseudomonas monteilii]|uniref:SGNH hydrolase domain-containing protein n=2 Tax=Pseudomonas TaxID=286 RepID=UPI0021F13064|nr:SGNH hydrolase domain-containing protein [Pseudomonas monteilii]